MVSMKLELGVSLSGEAIERLEVKLVECLNGGVLSQDSKALLGRGSTTQTGDRRAPRVTQSVLTVRTPSIGPYLTSNTESNPSFISD